MGTLYLRYERVVDEGYQVDAIAKSNFERFNPAILGLGKISIEADYQEALAAIFDLAGFTSFCGQIDPHLVVPEFVEKFLTWLFKEISTEFKTGKRDDKILLWCPLPFFAKFLGDGVLFLWDTKPMEPLDIGNIVISLMNICSTYREKFYPTIQNSFVRAPATLRCGIARGQVVAVGENADFVGPCINMASRLQKLGTYSFAFSRRGFDLERNFGSAWREGYFVTHKIDIRGVGDEELVWILATEEKRLHRK